MAESLDWYRLTADEEAKVASPALLIYVDRVEENLRRMLAMAGDSARLRPHVKTHKLPQVVAMKLRHGITKFKVATIAEAEMTAAAGGPDVLLAYQPVGPSVGRVIELVKKFPGTRFSVLADNVGTVGELSKAASAAGITLDVLIDLNVGQDRTGVPPGDEAVAVYRAIATSPSLKAGGLHAYDGHLQSPDEAWLTKSAAEAFEPVIALRRRLVDEGLPVPKVVASGTPTSRLNVGRHDFEVEVGAGTTVLWDFGQEEKSPDLKFLMAAVLLTRVISKPAEARVCVDLGHKAVAAEMPQPRVRFLNLPDAEPVLQSEEHLVIKTSRAKELKVGDVLYGVPRHVCPTVALHAEAVVVRDGRVIDRWPIAARARRITV